MHSELTFLGNPSYGGWYTAIESLGPQSVVYSFGVGTDISWDLALIEEFGCTVYAYDPDPKSAKWLKTQTLPPQFIFHAEGLATLDGMQRFYDPYNPNKVNMSTIRKNKTYIDLPVKRLATFMRENGHDHIDLLKIDIEGSEFAVIPDIAGLDIKQLLAEIHTSFYEFGWKGLKRKYGNWKTNSIFKKLQRSGFELVKVNDEDYTFVKS
jgi:FkbM family methyltransferase